MTHRVRRRLPALVAVSLTAVAAAAPAAARASTVTVCKHGCAYRTIQSAVDHTGRGATVRVKPGHYAEGVIVRGAKHDGLTITGTSRDATRTVLEGRNAHNQYGAAQNGIEADNVDRITFANLTAEHYVTNGFFVNGGRAFVMRNLVGGFNHSYGMYAFRNIGGRITRSVGYGNGDSAFYIGGTPPQAHPKTTLIDHDRGYRNVLGFSGTNSRYIVIRDSEFYDNGAGIVPNTLKSEPFEPATSGVIEHNLVYWNNFDYYRPGSPVKTVSRGVGNDAANYPIGAGVILFGTTGWTVRDNQIFGNFLWGAAAFSDPTNKTGKAVNNANRFVDNTMGAAMNDANGVDFFNDGSGTGTCFADNGTVTQDTSATAPTLYSPCPTTAGTGTDVGDGTQVGKLFAIVTAKPATKQESFWHVHAHPARTGRKPYEG